MDTNDLANLRLLSQHILNTGFDEPDAVVRYMLAMQAQDYAGGLWAVALRTKNSTHKDVEKAIAERRIVRTWPMRGTLHFLHADDVRWMVALLGERAAKAATGRRHNLGLTDKIMEEVESLVRKELANRKYLSRPKLAQLLKDKVKGIEMGNSQIGHVFRNFGERGIICFGPHEGKQPTFVLLDDWVPKTPKKNREQALTELVERYFTSHGPAQLTDLAGWAGINQGEAKLGLSKAKNIVSVEVEKKNYYMAKDAPKPATGETLFLLPGFDEYMLGYKDRSAALHADHANKIVPGGNGMFFPTIVENGQVVGTWKRTVKKSGIAVAYDHFDPKKPAQAKALNKALARYKQFAL